MNSSQIEVLVEEQEFRVEGRESVQNSSQFIDLPNQRLMEGLKLCHAIIPAHLETAFWEKMIGAARLDRSLCLGFR
jgi:hypothetical protein